LKEVYGTLESSLTFPERASTGVTNARRICRELLDLPDVDLDLGRIIQKYDLVAWSCMAAANATALIGSKPHQPNLAVDSNSLRSAQLDDAVTAVIAAAEALERLTEVREARKRGSEYEANLDKYFTRQRTESRLRYSIAVAAAIIARQDLDRYHWLEIVEREIRLFELIDIEYAQSYPPTRNAYLSWALAERGR
jgi:hypothetical protein